MAVLANVSQILLLLAGIFLMIVVLLQRGRGGGLAGAFGGLGGQSAFGTKAGDVFTRITIVIAIIWVALAGGSGFFLRAASEQIGSEFENNVQETQTEGGAGAVSEDGELDFPFAAPIDESPDTESATDGATEDSAETSADSPAPEPTDETPLEE